jgi:hypothetical protein
MTENSWEPLNHFSSVQQRGCEIRERKGLTSELDVIQELASESTD